MLVLKAHGKGSQVYDCDAATGTWIFREPAAALSRRGRTIGIHYAGPTWELFDGSKVTGAQAVTLPAPKPATDIPWLLLRATSHTGSGTLSTVDYVQRVFTKGRRRPQRRYLRPRRRQDRRRPLHRGVHVLLRRRIEGWRP